MKPAIVICSVFMTLIPPGLAGNSRIQCVICKHPNSWPFSPPGYQEKAPCGAILEDGSLCTKERTKIYYRCSKTDCKEITVKNKKFLDATKKEGCTHENKLSLAESNIRLAESNNRLAESHNRLAESNIRPTFEAPTSSETGGHVRSEVINDKVTYYHFFE
ncbi:hypothetical protein PGT21_016656 [Puccinia graminis f. sp. tritici]|uniref:Uncharacterized protein n=1 Tax=Puccinia graminis f. sp. tritici TaxID=56615 RepID=A0A5B0QG54_PUCGR|nr:hypothetical protein PGT21_018709 [Puccinia graminis f. sp. tritici]KAA1093399.1 hypothetical protein PGTUg99_007902 [Puccinia graminis f. sp. tritici]KAA1111943.1 hypothetical protein PGT21_016656 [Puccinia graminis f. sp. tritici]